MQSLLALHSRSRRLQRPPSVPCHRRHLPVMPGQWRACPLHPAWLLRIVLRAPGNFAWRSLSSLPRTRKRWWVLHHRLLGSLHVQRYGRTCQRRICFTLCRPLTRQVSPLRQETAGHRRICRICQTCTNELGDRLLVCMQPRGRTAVLAAHAVLQQYKKLYRKRDPARGQWEKVRSCQAFQLWHLSWMFTRRHQGEAVQKPSYHEAFNRAVFLELVKEMGSP